MSSIVKRLILVLLAFCTLASVALFTFAHQNLSRAHAAPGLQSASPSVSVYFGSDNDAFYALTADEGFLRWTYQYQQGGNTWSPTVVVNGVIYFEVANSSSTAIVSLRTDGSKRWIYQFPPQTVGRNALAVANGLVYFAVDSTVSNSALYALNAKGGSVAWTHSARANNSFGNPVVDNGMVYVAELPNSGSTNTPRLDALNASDGSVIWTQVLTSSPRTNLAAANGVIYFGGSDSSLYAIKETDGLVLWHSPVDGGPISTPGVGNGIIYYAAANYHVTAVNATDGSLVWDYLIGQAFAPTVSPAIYMTSNWTRVYIGSLNRNMYAFNASSGALVWKTKIGTPITTTASIKNGIVHVGLQNGTLRTLNTTNGVQRWFYHTNGSIYTSSPPALF